MAEIVQTPSSSTWKIQKTAIDGKTSELVNFGKQGEHWVYKSGRVSFGFTNTALLMGGAGTMFLGLILNGFRLDNHRKVLYDEYRKGQQSIRDEIKSDFDMNLYELKNYSDVVKVLEVDRKTKQADENLNRLHERVKRVIN